jgi:uncharacterized membrane protein
MDEPRIRDQAGGGREQVLRSFARFALAALLAVSGTGHLLTPEVFLAQVPPWFPGPGVVIFVSGIVELALAGALVFGSRWRVQIGWVVAGFFVVIFPGNVSQAITGTDAFGLDSPTARWLRLAFQPVLVAWALWSTGAWQAWRRRRR